MIPLVMTTDYMRKILIHTHSHTYILKYTPTTHVVYARVNTDRYKERGHNNPHHVGVTLSFSHSIPIHE